MHSAHDRVKANTGYVLMWFIKSLFWLPQGAVDPIDVIKACHYLHCTVKPALVTTCLQRPHFLFPLKMVSHWNMYWRNLSTVPLFVFPVGGRYRQVWLYLLCVIEWPRPGPPTPRTDGPHACYQNVLFVSKRKRLTRIDFTHRTFAEKGGGGGGGGAEKGLYNKRKRSTRIDFTHRTFAEKGGSLGTRICVP